MLEVDGREVQLLHFDCVLLIMHAICYYDIYHKSN